MSDDDALDRPHRPSHRAAPKRSETERFTEGRRGAGRHVAPTDRTDFPDHDPGWAVGAAPPRPEERDGPAEQTGPWRAAEQTGPARNGRRSPGTLAASNSDGFVAEVGDAPAGPAASDRGPLQAPAPDPQARVGPDIRSDEATSVLPVPGSRSAPAAPVPTDSTLAGHRPGQDLGKQDSGKQESGKQDSGKQESSKTGEFRGEPGQQRGRTANQAVQQPTRRQRRDRRAAERTSGGLFGMFKEAGIVLGTALVLSLLIKTFLAQAFYIPSGSMENTLAVGDRVMVSLLTPGPFDLERGDVVVFKDPGEWLTGVEEPERGTVSQAMVDAFTFIGVLPQDAGQHLIKRVIGLPGDDVACCDADGRITVNGAAIDESGYVREGARPSADPFDVKVPEGRLWVMGDNRANSDDSRAHYVATQDEEYSTVPISNVVGRAVFVFYPWSQRQWLDSQEAVFAEVP